MSGYGITNRGEDPLTLKSVRLSGSKGLTLLESVVIPGHAGIGQMNYPLQGEDITDSWWDRRNPVDGYVLEAGAHAEVELAVGLEPGAHKGSYTEYVIEYVDASGFNRSARATGFGIYFKDSEGCPDDPEDAA